MNSHLLMKGDIINDRYKILQYIGEGGMQQVYLANDLVIGRNIALKVPFNNSAAKRFKRSAILAAKVNHPHVAKTYDYIEDKGKQYLIEDYIDGEDLKSSILRKCRCLDPYLVARILHYLAKGISASHHVKVIHRDLKPSNILIRNGFNLSEIKITDFGIAKMAQEELEEAIEGGDATMTKSKTLVGALPYMSPEMILQGQVDVSTDIWSLGALTYELLTGELPYGQGLKAVSKITSGTPPLKPGFLEKNAQFKVLANEIFDIILLCMQIDAKKRPSADELVLKCEKLCYTISPRYIARIKETRYSAYGFISDGSNDIFFHFNSVYGGNPIEKTPVCFSCFPGGGAKRAHPVLILYDTK